MRKLFAAVALLAIITTLAFAGAPQGNHWGFESPKRALAQYVQPPVNPSINKKGEFWLTPQFGVDLHDTHYADTSRELLNNVIAPFFDATVTNCEFQGLVKPSTGINHVKWGMRLYDVADMLVDRCEFYDIGQEHGMYLDIVGDVEVRDSFFHDIGSQGYQSVFRYSGTSNAHWQANNAFEWIHHSVFWQCTQPSGARPAFTISSHKPEGPLVPGRVFRVSNVFMHANYPTFKAGGFDRNSFGAVMCEGKGSATLVKSWIEYRNPDRPVVQFHNNTTAIIRSNHIAEGKVSIKGATKIRVSGNTGGAILMVDGKNLGPISGLVYNQG